MLELVKLVEKRVSHEINLTRGALIFDSWTCGSTHYVAAMTSYCAKQADSTEIQPRLSCLFLSPMGKLADIKDEDEGKISVEIDNGNTFRLLEVNV